MTIATRLTNSLRKKQQPSCGRWRSCFRSWICWTPATNGMSRPFGSWRSFRTLAQKSGTSRWTGRLWDRVSSTIIRWHCTLSIFSKACKYDREVIIVSIVLTIATALMNHHFQNHQCFGLQKAPRNGWRRSWRSSCRTSCSSSKGLGFVCGAKLVEAPTPGEHFNWW